MKRSVAVRLLHVLLGAALLWATPTDADYITGLDPQGDNFLALRTGPGTTYALVLRMGPNTIVTVLEEHGNWRRVRLDDGTTGWAYSRYIAPGYPPGDGSGALVDITHQTDDATGQTGAVVGSVALRVSPSPRSATLHRLRNGSGVIMLGATGNWLRVLSETGDIGYAAAQYVAIGLPPTAVPAKTSSKGPSRPSAAGLEPWSIYTNTRFGTRIEYPAGYFSPHPAPANNDGRSFQSSDGRAEFMVFGQFNVFGRNLTELREEDRFGGGYDSVTYAQTKDEWYVLSGFIGDRVFYRRVMLRQRGEVVHVFQITYPAADKLQIDPVAGRMSRSFTAP